MRLPMSRTVKVCSVIYTPAMHSFMGVALVLLWRGFR